jgi:hypothetical protein
MKKEALQHLMACGQHHVSMAKIHNTAAKETDGPVADFHKSAAAVHTDHAEHCLAMCKKFSSSDVVDTHDDSRGVDSLKVFGMTAAMKDADQLVPSLVRGVMPTDVPPGARLVNRPGGAPLDKSSAVPSEFKHLVETE